MWLQLSGVSFGTASQALNYRSSVAISTRLRVFDVTKSLGYPVKTVPDYKPYTDMGVIGMLTKHDSGNLPEVSPFYSHTPAGIESECRKYNINLMFANVEVDPSNHPVVWLAMIQEARIDGLLLACVFIEGAIGFLRWKLDIPIVLVDSYAPNMPFDSVLIDNAPGTALAINYLIGLRHTNIGLVGTNQNSPPSLLKRQHKFKRTMTSKGLSAVFFEESEVAENSGYTSTKKLLDRFPQITVIFTGRFSCF